MSLAASEGVISSLGTNPLPCFSASISSEFTWSTILSNSSCSSGVDLISMPLESIRSTARSNSTLASASAPLVVGAATRIGRLNLSNEHLHALLFRGKRGRRGGSRSLGRISRRQRRRGGLLRLRGRRSCMIRGRATGQNESQRGGSQHETRSWRSTPMHILGKTQQTAQMGDRSGHYADDKLAMDGC